MESDIADMTLAKPYIGILHFLVRYYLPVYMKQAIYRLTNKSLWKVDILQSRFIV